MTDPTTAEHHEDPWTEVIGQEAAVADLRAAVSHPVHAYLLVGPQGSGTLTAARVFAAELLSRGEDDPAERSRHHRLAAADQHPAIFVEKRTGTKWDRDHLRRVVRRASTSPPEGRLQVIILEDFHSGSDAAPVLLKTLEEPPESTAFVILATEVPPELATIASRCVRIDFTRVADADLALRLRSEGLPGDVVDAAVSAAAGDADLARELASDPDSVQRWRAWTEVSVSSESSGAEIMAVVDRLIADADAVVAHLEARHEAERERAKTALEQRGGPAGELRELERLHKAERRRVRTDALRGGILALLGRYRKAVSDEGSADRLVRVGELVAEWHDRSTFNPREDLTLVHLLWHLPGGAPRPSDGGG